MTQIEHCLVAEDNLEQEVLILDGEQDTESIFQTLTAELEKITATK